MENLQDTLLEACLLIANNPLLAADKLEVIGQRLISMARELRDTASPLPGVSEGGFGDRVLVNVVRQSNRPNNQ